MGGLISAPLSGAGTCLGGCFGSCLATGCCKLAGSGNVSSAQASRCVLIWLQVFAAVLAVFLSATAEQWLPWTCGKLDLIGLGELGICDCRLSADGCWSDQLIYRTEASAVIVFLALVIMSVSGCAEGAARAYSVAKFMAVVCLVFIALFVPNKVWTVFGSWATALSAIFLVAQSIVLIDFGYTWNETWYKYALEARGRQVGAKGYRMWLGGMLLASAALILGALSISIYLFIDFKDASSRAVNACAMVLSIALLIVSITDWCEHGALLTSAVVMAYTVWLICECLAVSPHACIAAIPHYGLQGCSHISEASFSASLWDYTGIVDQNIAVLRLFERHQLHNMLVRPLAA
ncbi:Membrane protein TMS1 [Durusdinium trenchii]|uniref:Membrane protein TMS1 n=1 Tax=Durusdinium trenchii TaxID=1381693 RepID=A0ABP0L829_9DINO